MKAANRALKVPVPPISRGSDGKFKQTQGEKLLEAHRKQEREKRGG